MIGSGPSLTQADVDRCRGEHVIVVNDAWTLAPWAEVLYGCDEKWWVHKYPHGFGGEKWSSDEAGHPTNRKSPAFKDLGLNIVQGHNGAGFSFVPGIVHYGSSSGFQAINLALQFGATQVFLLGFDNRADSNQRTHFFGNHPDPFSNPCKTQFANVIHSFRHAADLLPPDITIFNASRDTSIPSFPRVTLDELERLQALDDLRKTGND